MRGAATLALVLPLALGCGDGLLGAVLDRVGVAHYREVDAAEARRLVEERGALLLQVRGDEHARTLAPGARLVRTDDDFAVPGDGRPIVIVAEDPVLGARLASRLARDGVCHLHFSAGGLEAWAAPRAEVVQPPATGGIGAGNGT